MKKKIGKKKKIVIVSIIVGAFIILGVGGYYLSVQNDANEKEPALSEQEKEIQENLSTKEEQLEENTANTDTSQNNGTNQTEPTSSLTTLSDANITATKAGSTVYLSVYGIGQGSYEVEKNGTKITLTDSSYVGTGGLILPQIATTEAKANYQIFLLTNGKRSASSKVITVTTNFDGTKTFVGQ